MNPEIDFFERRYLLAAGVSMPRPETELLALIAIDGLPAPSARTTRVLDIGCGTGCLGFAIADRRADVHVDAIDVDPAAVACALMNARRLGLASRARVLLADLFSADWLRRARPPYDAIVCNPPYLPAGREPGPPLLPTGERRDAIASSDGAWSFYERIAEMIPALLAVNGFIGLEIGYNDGRRIAALFEAEIEGPSIVADRSGVPRVIHGRRRASGGAVLRPDQGRRRSEPLVSRD